MAEPNRNAPQRAQPISRHPLFPPIIGLWFAVLVGLGSFAVHPSALELLVLAGHVDTLIPAAAPPLGMTARLLLALVLGAAAGAIGWAIAARMAATGAMPAPQVLKVAECDLDEPLPWPGMASPEMPASEIMPAPEMAGEPLSDEQLAQQCAPAFDVAGDVAGQAPPHTAAQRIAASALGELSHVELVERLAIAIRRRQERLEAAGEVVGSGPVVRFPGLADRLGARRVLPEPAPRPAPQETEKALRNALAALQRMSGGA